MAVKKDALSKWTARILIGSLLVVGLFAIAKAATDCLIQFRWDTPPQKTIWSHEADGVLVAQDTNTDGRQSYDTTFSGTDGQLNIWHYRIWEESTGLPWSFFVYRDLNTTADASEDWNVDTLYLPDTADTIVQEFLRDGTVLKTRTYTSVASVPETTWSCAGGTFSEVLYTIKYDAADSGSTFSLAYDLLGDSVTGGGTPTTGHTCRITILVKTIQELPDSGRTIVAYPVRAFVKDSSGQVVTLAPVKATTNALGQATMDLMWSKYFVPPLNYQFVLTTPYGSLRKTDSVPSQTTYTLNLMR